jgi:hypothetical protein
MLKILMEAIEAIEKEQPEPHESSFCPMLEGAHIANGSNAHPRMEGAGSTGPAPLRARTSSTVESRRIYTPFGHSNTGSRLPEAQPLDNTGTDASSNNKGFLPCHYFDYIAGTSTGG